MYSWQDINNYHHDNEDKNLSHLKRVIDNYLNNTTSKTPFHKVIHSIEVSKWTDKYIETVDLLRQKFSSLVVISMGGANLNPQAVLQLSAHKKNNFPIFFINNTDPYFFEAIVNKLDLNKTAFLIISSSGETLETNAIIGAVINRFELQQIDNYGENLYFIVGKNENSLRSLAKRINGNIFDHEEDISGRFAGLTNVTCFIGMVAGLNMREYLTGANESIEEFKVLKHNSKPAMAALANINCPHNLIINLAYLQNFSSFLEWYCQIIAESLGKNGQGFTPLRGIGPNDQHSMMQLYLEGAKDKVFNLLYVKNLTSLSTEISVKMDSSILKDKTLADVNDASFNSIRQTFNDYKLPYRTIILDDLTEKSIGSLVAHCMIEVILTGYMLDINPFDQPGVEHVKSHVKNLLENL